MGNELNDLDEKYRMGEWSGLPNYGCPYCAFRTLKGGMEVAWHIDEQHREQEEIIPLAETTQSAIVDTEGGTDATDSDSPDDSAGADTSASTGSSVSTAGVHSS